MRRSPLGVARPVRNAAAFRRRAPRLVGAADVASPGPSVARRAPARSRWEFPCLGRARGGWRLPRRPFRA